MPLTDTPPRVQLDVISGGRSDSAPLPALPHAEKIRLSAPELAAEFAEMAALALLQNCPLAQLSNPHQDIDIDGATRVNLHELLCEMRNLAWNDHSAALSLGPSDTDKCASGRRALRWNCDGQLTLRTLLRSGVRQNGAGTGVSKLLALDHEAAKVSGEPVPSPEGQTMTDWLVWCLTHSGAGLRLPGHPTDGASIQTGADLAHYIHKNPPARPFHNAALAALGRGMATDSGLGDASLPWSGPRLFALMAEAETRSRRLATSLLARPDHRLSRPAVIAAKLTVFLSQSDGPSDATDPLGHAAQELGQAAPNLMHWLTRANLSLRGFKYLTHSLFLPLTAPQQAPLHPTDIKAHVIIAGSLATLLKAVFNTLPIARAEHRSTATDDASFGADLDHLAANYAQARCIAGSYFPCENHQDLRLGESIALQLLRDTLEQDNRSARMTLRDFDGRMVQIDASPRPLNRGVAHLRVGAEPTAWPQHSSNLASHLTAVV